MDTATAAIQTLNSVHAQLEEVIAMLNRLQHMYWVSAVISGLCVALWVAYLWVTAHYNRATHRLIAELTEQVDNYKLRVERLENLTGFAWDREEG